MTKFWKNFEKKIWKILKKNILKIWKKKFGKFGEKNMDKKFMVKKYPDHKKYLTRWQIAKCHGSSGSPWQSCYWIEICNLKTFLLFFRDYTVMNSSTNVRDNVTSEDSLEDFEVFDLRDAINVGAYSVMSASRLITSSVQIVGVIGFYCQA